MQYRPFALPDIHEILALGEKMHRETQYHNLEFDKHTAANSIYEQVIKPDTGFGMLAVDGAIPVGMIAGFYTGAYFSRDRIAIDQVWYVLPEYRGSRTAIKLFKMYEAWAIEKECSTISMSVSSGLAVDKTHDMMRRLGYDHTGGNYVRAIK